MLMIRFYITYKHRL